MSYDRLTIYDRDREPDHRILILLHSLDEYEKNLGREKLLELSVQYPGFIKDRQRELAEFNKLQFLLWLLNEKILGEKIAEEERIRKEIALAVMWESLNEEMKRNFDQERWNRNWQAYLAEISKETWNRLQAIEQDRLRKEFFSLVLDAIDKQIDHLTTIVAELRAWVEHGRKIIYIQEAEEAKAMQDIIRSLSKMPLAYEAKKQFIIDELEKFIASEERLIPVLLDSIMPTYNELKQHVLDPINEYGQSDSKRVHELAQRIENKINLNVRKTTFDKVEQVTDTAAEAKSNLIQTKEGLQNAGSVSKSQIDVDALGVIYRRTLEIVRLQDENIADILKMMSPRQDIDERTLASYSSDAQQQILLDQPSMSALQDKISKQIEESPLKQHFSSDEFETDLDLEEKPYNEIKPSSFR